MREIDIQVSCLVCFQENEFLKTIFLTFPCLVNIKKIDQRKLNSS